MGCTRWQSRPARRAKPRPEAIGLFKRSLWEALNDVRPASLFWPAGRRAAGLSRRPRSPPPAAAANAAAVAIAASRTPHAAADAATVPVAMAPVAVAPAAMAPARLLDLGRSVRGRRQLAQNSGRGGRRGLSRTRGENASKCASSDGQRNSSFHLDSFPCWSVPRTPGKFP